MAPLTIRLDNQRLLPGYSAGLNQRTALLEITVDGVIEASVFSGIHDGVMALYPEQPLFGVGESDWPTAFVINPAGDGDDPLRQLGDWVIAVAIAVQRWAREPAWRGQVVAADHRRVRLALPWHRPGVFSDAVRMALQMIELWSDPNPQPDRRDHVIGMFRNGLETVQAEGLYPSTLRFVLAALERGIPFEVLPSCVQFGWGAGLERLDSSFTSHTGFIAAATARRKFKASRTLLSADIPVPVADVVADFDAATSVVAELGWPVVIKPGDQDQGLGVVPGITDTVVLRRAFDAAVQLSPDNVIVERHVEGDDHRLLVVRGQLLAAARRIRGGVTGDGVHTVEQLVDAVNSDPRRGTNPRSVMMRLVFDTEAMDCLAAQGVHTGSVPEPGRFVYLRRTANISTGGAAEDVTRRIHPDNRLLAQRAARMIGLDIAGIDFLTTDITRSWRDVGGAICEVNAQPGLRPHWIADPGRDINGEILDTVLAGRSTRMPTAVITGAGDAGATAILLHRIWSAAGRFAALCGKAGVIAGDDLITAEPVPPVVGFPMVAIDPAVHAFVVEVTGRQLAEEGHPCDRYDVAALLGPGDDPAAVVEVLQRATRAVVINRDDPFCVAAMPDAAAQRSVLVTSEPAPPGAFRRNGSDTVYCVEREGQRWVMLSSVHGETPVVAIAGEAQPALFATACAWAHDIPVGTIRAALDPLLTVGPRPG